MLSEELPIREQVPPQVAAVLSIAEVVTGWSKWQAECGSEPRASFYEGIFDYWWDNSLIEPEWDAIFPLHNPSNTRSIPSRERFSYQQGAMVGYHLRETYK